MTQSVKFCVGSFKIRKTFIIVCSEIGSIGYSSEENHLKVKTWQIQHSQRQECGENYCGALWMDNRRILRYGTRQSFCGLRAVECGAVQSTDGTAFSFYVSLAITTIRMVPVADDPKGSKTGFGRKLKENWRRWRYERSFFAPCNLRHGADWKK